MACVGHYEINPPICEKFNIETNICTRIVVRNLEKIKIKETLMISETVLLGQA